MMEAVYIMGGLGIVVGLGLAVASKVFHVYVDPKILAVDDVLPGANCGGCGYPGCMPNAEAIVAGKSSPNSCVAAGAETAEEIAALMGVAIEAKEPDIARLGCTYNVQDAELKFFYNGMHDCKAAALLSGGMKVCDIGCLGLGSCQKACPFNAITIGPEGLPIVNEKRCTGCGTCEKVCPKNIITMSSATRRIIKEYTTQDCTTPCQRTCPAGIDICQYINEIALGNYHKSVQIIKERNPFPTVIGRICPRPCETECRRQFVDEPVAINFLKRFVADYEMAEGKRILPYKAPDTSRKIAIVGGGVEGLSTGFFLARLGHNPYVYEATSNLGGLLRKAIAIERLPLNVLDWDIEGIIKMGVKIETDKKLGESFTTDSLLKEGFEAVFLASGGWDSRLSRGVVSNVESPIPDTYLLIDLIKSSDHEESLQCGSNVVIAGGGDLAIDAAKKCKALGAKKITIMFRESEDENPQVLEKIDKSLSEDLNIIFNTGIVRLKGTDDKLEQIEYIDLLTKQSKSLNLDTLFISSGRFPQLIFVKCSKPEMETQEEGEAKESKEVSLSPSSISWEAFESNKKPSDKDNIGWMAKGDPLTDFTGAIMAIGAGRRAAASIHQTLYDLPLTFSENVLTDSSEIQNVDHVENISIAPRQIMPLSSDKDIAESRELETGFTEAMAQKEAHRCLKCGLICYKDKSNG